MDPKIKSITITRIVTETTIEDDSGTKKIVKEIDDEFIEYHDTPGVLNE